MNNIMADKKTREKYEPLRVHSSDISTTNRKVSGPKWCEHKNKAT